MVPNVFHFIFGLSEDFGGKPFSFSHYMAVRSAIIVNKPHDVIFHYQYEPTGEYWDLIKGQITLKKIEAPIEIHGNKLFHVAHKADIIRLQALYETGGVYLDIDTISIKPLDCFRKYPELVHKISPFAFHYPLHNQRGLELLFEKSAYFPKAYIHHLWESASWDKYLKHLNAETVRTDDTTYNLIARKYL